MRWLSLADSGDYLLLLELFVEDELVVLVWMWKSEIRGFAGELLIIFS